jgi:Tol biopolymer transport system component
LGLRQARQSERGIEGFDFSVVRYDLNSDQTTLLVEGGASPTLSRDGRTLVYMRVNDARATLNVAHADGSESRTVPLQTRPQFFFSPRLSPDGRTVAFGAPSDEVRSRNRSAGALLAWIATLGAQRAAAHGAPMAIWRVNVESGKVEQLAALLDDEPRAAWADDGGMYVIATNSLYEVPPESAVAKPIGPGKFNGDIDIAPQRP